MSERPQNRHLIPAKPGEVRNPHGRQKGSRNRASLLLEELLEGEAQELGRKAIERAKDGDVQCLRLCLERLLPPRRDRHVTFSVPEIKTAQDAVAFAGEVLSKTAAGELTPSEAADLGKLVENYVRALETTDLERRLAELEQRGPQR
jgi:hypothetical protein